MSDPRHSFNPGPTNATLHAALMATTSDAVLITDDEHFAVAVNNAFVHRTGYALEDIQAHPWTAIGERDDDDALLEEIEHTLAHAPCWQRTLWIRRANGELIQVAVSVTCTDDPGTHRRFQIVFSDPSEARAALGSDPLTGLRDANHIRALLAQRLASPIGPLRPFLMLIALDHFARVNEQLGWSRADLALQTTARRLRDRVSDQGVVARVAGDRFAVLHHGIADTTEASAWAETLLAHLSQPLDLHGHTLTLTASVGVVVAPDDGRDVDALWRRLDLATRLAKQAGRNTWRRAPMHTPILGVPSLSGLDELRTALRAAQFEVFFQPRVALRSGHITAVEALLRWQHPTRGNLSPEHFLPLAERAGVLVELGDWSIRAATTQLQRWREQGRPTLLLSLRLSLSQLLDEWLLERLEQVLVANELPPTSLEIECNTSIFFDNHSKLTPVFRRLGALGVHLALGDFGQTPFPLAALFGASLYALKLDPRVVQSLPDAALATTLVEGVVAMAHATDLRVYASGVETPEQLERLRALHCDEAQGYFFGRPMPAREVSMLLRRKRSH